MKRIWHKAKIFNKKTFPRIFGVHLAGVAMALSVVAVPTHAFDYTVAQTVQSDDSSSIVMTTKAQYQFPLETTLGMSQGYHAFHPGVDLRAPKGTAIYTMAEGTVIEVEEMMVGYGHFVRIAHQGTLSTLYAHLDEVQVTPGQKVQMGETIGTVGLTGWSTGYHLHFEVYEGTKSVNPMRYVSANSK
jgi:murein DD-endopeptidase MepM/ murein hydrolase activator NlpD